MNRSRWRIAGICIAADLLVIWALVWFTGQLNPNIDTGVLAYRPDNLPPPVDLAALQRSWPGSFDEQGERTRLIAYRHDLERQTPALVAAPAAPRAEPLDLGTLLASASGRILRVWEVTTPKAPAEKGK